MAVWPDDPKFGETILDWNEELENKYDSDNVGTDYEDNVSIQSDLDSIVSVEEEEYEDSCDFIDANREEETKQIDSERVSHQHKKWKEIMAIAGLLIQVAPTSSELKKKCDQSLGQKYIV